ncbi:hypothetical protein AXG93_3822s1040 [Marchantia polymorpha subsp. ruderalis]|uniref:Uncharacterized protein n=1 Tax=Marchantia polymorpha subsp. ruderalis TaxID=1480154 RepID=A0A176WK73_MARPO|nr:hypothetical protein AXG93_3822s1040 [Marchantia polymorpha subsp. ruderalis]
MKSVNPQSRRLVWETNGNSRLAIEKAEKMIFIASHAKLERRDFVNEEEKDAELFMNGEDDRIPDEVFLSATL